MYILTYILPASFKQEEMWWKQGSSNYRQFLYYFRCSIGNYSNPFSLNAIREEWFVALFSAINARQKMTPTSKENR